MTDSGYCCGTLVFRYWVDPIYGKAIGCKAAAHIIPTIPSPVTPFPAASTLAMEDDPASWGYWEAFWEKPPYSEPLEISEIRLSPTISPSSGLALRGWAVNSALPGPAKVTLWSATPFHRKRFEWIWAAFQIRQALGPTTPRRRVTSGAVIAARKSP